MSIPDRAPAFRPGDVVEARYRILELIAEGGMGTVFLAQHLLIKRRVALKLLHPELAVDHTMVQRFLDEASAAGTLGHPNIVESTDMGFTRDHVPYIVFEYLEGTLLTDEVYRVRGLPVARALRIARQIASALEAAHAAGIVHLDLKADNVFLSHRDGTVDHVKVLDFGIARFLEPDREITGRNLLVGTPEYMAPEQVATPDEIDHRADIYSLGVVLYEMLAGRRPFEGDDPRALLHRIVHEPVPPLALPGIPPEVSALVGRLLAKDRNERYPTMRDVEAAIDELGLASAVRRSAPSHSTLSWGTAPLVPPRPATEPPEPEAVELDVEMDIEVDDLVPPTIATSDIPPVIVIKPRARTVAEPAPRRSAERRAAAEADADLERWIADHRTPSTRWLIGSLVAALVSGGLWVVRQALDTPTVATALRDLRGAAIDLDAVAQTLREAGAISLMLAGVLLLIYVGAWVRRRDIVA